MTQFSENVIESAQAILAKDIMTSEVLSVYEGWSIKRLADFFVKHKISGAPVIASDHSLIGVVSITDIVKFDSLSSDEKAKLMVENVYPEYLGQNVAQEVFNQLAVNADQNCTINSIMTRDVIKADGEAALPEIAKLMDSNKIRRIFVTDEGKIAGVISTGNILRSLSELA
ncbi:MAG: CBS domain-containing protein [Pseudomonadales bacterium]|nr:CBS domain-containing protein [Pseudomonadales bacterium]